jgi:hypothetical protein
MVPSKRCSSSIHLKKSTRKKKIRRKRKKKKRVIDKRHNVQKERKASEICKKEDKGNQPIKVKECEIARGRVLRKRRETMRKRGKAPSLIWSPPSDVHPRTSGLNFGQLFGDTSFGVMVTMLGGMSWGVLSSRAGIGRASRLLVR